MFIYLSGCTVHAYDPTTKVKINQEILKYYDDLHYHRIGIGKGDGKTPIIVDEEEEIRFAHFRFSGGKRKNLNGKFPAGKMDRKKGKIGTKKGRKKYNFLPLFGANFSLSLVSFSGLNFNKHIFHKNNT